MGAGHQQVQTITCRMDRQQSPPVQHREVSQSPGINRNGKGY